MKANGWLAITLVLTACAALPGCLVPQSELATSQTQNRVLAQQNRAQLAEIDNLKAHGRNVENQLIRTEQELQRWRNRSTWTASGWPTTSRRPRVARPVQDGGGRGAAAAGGQPAIGRPLAPLSQPELRSGHWHRQGRHRRALRQRPGRVEAGRPGDARQAEPHSANAGRRQPQGHGRRPHRQSAARRQGGAGPLLQQLPPQHRPGLAVADQLRRQGLGERRIGVAGFGPYQPVAPNGEPGDRQKNRRVEIFVMAPDVPVVGWTDSIPSVY